MATCCASLRSDKDMADFLRDVRDRLGPGVDTDAAALSIVNGVLQTFRRRLTPPQVIAFGDALPAMLRAMLVYRWRVDAVALPFGSRSELIREVHAACSGQMIPALNVIEATAFALWRHCEAADLRLTLSQIGPEALAFWTVPGLTEADAPVEIG